MKAYVGDLITDGDESYREACLHYVGPVMKYVTLKIDSP